MVRRTYGLAIDIGTSGLRVQSIDLTNFRILSTGITLGHPIPGANVMDHLHFALEVGKEFANRLIVQALNHVIRSIQVDSRRVEVIGVCGNPIQLSLFQDMEIRDLAFAGLNAKLRLGVENVRRDARVMKAGDIGLDVNPEAEVFIPPAVEHEIGADALAMMRQTGFLESEEATMVTDFGTNAEMALKVDDEIFTGSAAAGPAIEGQHIKGGMLAAPGAICDVEPTPDGHLRMFALDDKMSTVVSDVVDPITGKVLSPGNVRLRGITGTGVIGLVSTGLETGLMRPGQINAKQTALRLQDDVVFDQEDLIEVGKTISAFVAGHMTLAAESGISLKDIRTMFMSGASGTYMSPHKAARIGLIPGAVRRTVQAGNTSLALAREIVRFPGILDELQEVADSLRARHIMFAGSKVFENAFAVEMGIWCEGMPQSLEAKMLKQFGLEPRPTPSGEIHSVKLSKCDIQDVGENGLKVVGDIGVQLSGEPEGCLGDARCVKACNEEAIRLDRIGDRWRITISSDKCMGTACRRCEEACRMRILKIEKFRITKSDDLDVITRSAS